MNNKLTPQEFLDSTEFNWLAVSRPISQEEYNQTKKQYMYEIERYEIKLKEKIFINDWYRVELFKEKPSCSDTDREYDGDIFWDTDFKSDRICLKISEIDSIDWTEFDCTFPLKRLIK